jgi:hypothetical protein
VGQAACFVEKCWWGVKRSERRLHVTTCIRVTQPSTHKKPSQLFTGNLLGGDLKVNAVSNRGELRVLTAATVASPNPLLVVWQSSTKIDMSSSPTRKIPGSLRLQMKTSKFV